MMTMKMNQMWQQRSDNLIRRGRDEEDNEEIKKKKKRGKGEE